MRYNEAMLKTITQRELGKASNRIIKALEAGDSFVVTRNGVPVGELRPFRRRGFVAKAGILAAFRRTAPIDSKRFQEDLDALADQETTPNG
jgi:antitoxin (DNA-binding transcriptional repressor) of toxin-antitoxin stability system